MVSLFDDNLPISVREKLAAAIVRKTKKQGKLKVRKPELPEVNDSSILADFAGPCSRLLFYLVGVSTEFLEKYDWHNAHDSALPLKRLAFEAPCL